jgi:hypothetical protein
LYLNSQYGNLATRKFISHTAADYAAEEFGAKKSSFYHLEMLMTQFASGNMTMRPRDQSSPPHLWPSSLNQGHRTRRKGSDGEGEGIEGDFSGHSLRARLPRAVASADVPEHAIMNQTGRKSLANMVISQHTKCDIEDPTTLRDLRG